MIKVDVDISDYIVLNEDVLDYVTSTAAKTITDLMPEIDEERFSFEHTITCSVIITINN